MVNPWRIGGGIGAMLFGVYLVFQFKQDIIISILGIIAISLGIGIVASDLK